VTEAQAALTNIGIGLRPGLLDYAAELYSARFEPLRPLRAGPLSKALAWLLGRGGGGAGGRRRGAHRGLEPAGEVETSLAEELEAAGYDLGVDGLDAAGRLQPLQRAGDDVAPSAARRRRLLLAVAAGAAAVAALATSFGGAPSGGQWLLERTGVRRAIRRALRGCGGVAARALEAHLHR